LKTQPLIKQRKIQLIQIVNGDSCMIMLSKKFLKKQCYTVAVSTLSYTCTDNTDVHFKMKKIIAYKSNKILSLCRRCFHSKFAGKMKLHFRIIFNHLVEHPLRIGKINRIVVFVISDVVHLKSHKLFQFRFVF